MGSAPNATHAQPFSVAQSATVGALINALLNGLLGWAVVPETGMPLWGLTSVTTDLLAMSSGIAFGTALVVTPQLRGIGRRGAMTLPPLPPFLRDGFAKWPAHVLLRSVNLGALGVILFAPLPLAALAVLAPAGLSTDAFVAFKTAFAAVEGAVVTPIIALAGLSDVVDGRV